MRDNDLLNDDLHQVTLCEALDRILNKGVVIAGEVTISVANVDLIYLGLNLLLGSIDTIRNVNTENLDRASSICTAPGMRQTSKHDNDQFPV
jgi:hypothetical protein